MKNIKLLGDKVLIEVADTSKTASGIQVIETEDASSYKRGVVLAVGPGNVSTTGFQKPLQVVIGDIVLFNFGQEISVNGQRLSLVGESDVVMIFTEE